jgi:hypothetical protein
MKNFWIYTALILSITSCQTVLENVPIPEIPQKAVVFGNIEVDGQYHSFRITKSKPILNASESNDYDVITDADVTVSSGANSYTFTYSKVEELYEYFGTLNLTAGEAILQVVTPTLGTLTSKVEVPEAIGAFDLKVDSIVRDYEVQYNILFTFPARDVPQYFRLEGFTGYASDTFPAYATNEYFTNEENLDLPIKLKSSLYKWKDDQGGSADLFVNVTRISKEYYTYGKALQTYNPDNPFAEPKPLPNNITGGLGLFAITRTIRVKIE